MRIMQIYAWHSQHPVWGPVHGQIWTVVWEAHSLLSSNSNSLEVMGDDLGTRMPKCSHLALKEFLSFSSAVRPASVVQARVLSFLHKM